MIRERLLPILQLMSLIGGERIVLGLDIDQSALSHVSFIKV